MLDYTPLGRNLRDLPLLGISLSFMSPFSRLHPEPPQGDEDQIKYVQDNMRVHWRELAKWVMEDEAVVYVCG